MDVVASIASQVEIQRALCASPEPRHSRSVREWPSMLCTAVCWLESYRPLAREPWSRSPERYPLKLAHCRSTDSLSPDEYGFSGGLREHRLQNDAARGPHLCLELGCLATTTDAVYLLVARATAAAFRVRHIGLGCLARLSGIQGRRKPTRAGFDGEGRARCQAKTESAQESTKSGSCSLLSIVLSLSASTRPRSYAFFLASD